VINSNLGPISHCFRDTATYSLQQSIENCGQTAADGDMITILTAYRKSPAPCHENPLSTVPAVDQKTPQ